MGKACSFCNIHYRPWLNYPKSESVRAIEYGVGVELYRGVDRFGIYMMAVADDSSKKFYLDFCPKCGRQLRVYKENSQC